MIRGGDSWQQALHSSAQLAAADGATMSVEAAGGNPEVEYALLSISAPNVVPPNFSGIERGVTAGATATPSQTKCG